MLEGKPRSDGLESFALPSFAVGQVANASSVHENLPIHMPSPFLPLCFWLAVGAIGWPSMCLLIEDSNRRNGRMVITSL